MKAVIKDIIKEENPRLDTVSGASVPTPVVVVEVEYYHDSGELHSSSRHAFLPEEITDLSIFDRQAEIMQRDIEDAKRQTVVQQEYDERHKPADDKVAELRKHFKLDFADQVPLGEASHRS